MNVFDAWKGKPLDEALLECRELYEDASYPTVRRWREAGGRVLGHFQVYFPEELAHAAGLLPVKVRGATIDAMQAESRFGSYLCSILKTSLELAISKKLELDFFVSHPICDAARNLAAVFARNTSYPCQILYLPQNANSKHAATYLAGEYRRLLSDIEGVRGQKVTDDALRRSIAVFNRNRALLRELYELRRDAPWLVAADEAYVLTGLAGILPREEHNELLQWMLQELRKRGGRQQDRIRVVFEGGFCEQPPLDLIRMIGQSCYLVDDDLLIGLRWITSDVPTQGDPVAALAESYLERSSYSPVQHDLRKPKEKMLLERIRESRADAAILAAAKMCEPGLEEQVAYTRALDEHKVPYFVTEFQETMTSFDQLEIQLETFVENLLFA
ncbi:MAG: 2-hydroxyacyl-CoA dehydratase [Planctomycetes bacterium]|nr:2-hydroxyacyl-CoA dehydratase [Planctomycetota bacterium]